MSQISAILTLLLSHACRQLARCSPTLAWWSDGPESDGSFASQKRIAELHDLERDPTMCTETRQCAPRHSLIEVENA